MRINKKKILFKLPKPHKKLWKKFSIKPWIRNFYDDKFEKLIFNSSYSTNEWEIEWNPQKSPHAVQLFWICRLYVFSIYPQSFKSRTENHIKKFSLLIYKSERINCLYTLHAQILKLLPLKLKTWSFQLP